jgi:hypothetical protein
MMKRERVSAHPYLTILSILKVFAIDMPLLR